MLPTKKQLEVARGANLSFFGSDTHYKKLDEIHNFFWEDVMMLLTPKGFSPLSTWENVWMWTLPLRLNPKLVFPYQRVMFEEIFPISMVVCCLDLHVKLYFDANLITIATFDN
jgi:hypothetical protein